MLTKIKNIFRKSPEQKLNLREKIITDFFTEKNHAWLLTDRYVRYTFEEMFDALPDSAFELWDKQKRILFIPSSGRYSSALHNEDAHVILVYPELMRLLHSTSMNHSIAIILHELGHILLEHAKRAIDPLEAQIEADRFAAKLGFFKEIESFLNDQVESVEKRTRLSYLTMEYFKQHPET
jgi:hypothetical protein